MTNRVRGWLFVAGQFALIGLSLALPGDHTESLARASSQVVFFAGAIALVTAFVQLGSSLTAHPEPLAKATLKVHGLYRVVRHPIYSALILLMLGSTGMAPSLWRWVTLLALTILLFFKARWEESLLQQRYPDYAQYALRVPMLVPTIRRVDN